MLLWSAVVNGVVAAPLPEEATHDGDSQILMPIVSFGLTALALLWCTYLDPFAYLYLHFTSTAGSCDVLQGTEVPAANTGTIPLQGTGDAR